MDALVQWAEGLTWIDVIGLVLCGVGLVVGASYLAVVRAKRDVTHLSPEDALYRLRLMNNYGIGLLNFVIFAGTVALLEAKVAGLHHRWLALVAFLFGIVEGIGISMLVNALQHATVSRLRQAEWSRTSEPVSRHWRIRPGSG